MGRTQESRVTDYWDAEKYAGICFRRIPARYNLGLGFKRIFINSLIRIILLFVSLCGYRQYFLLVG